MSHIITLVDGHGDDGYLCSAIGDKRLPAKNSNGKQSVENLIAETFRNISFELKEIRVMVCSGANRAQVDEFDGHEPISIMDGVRSELEKMGANNVYVKGFECFATVVSPDSGKPIIAIKTDENDTPFKLQEKLIKGIQEYFEQYLLTLKPPTVTFKERAKALRNFQPVLQFYENFTHSLEEHYLVIDNLLIMQISGILPHLHEFQSELKKAKKFIKESEKQLNQANRFVEDDEVQKRLESFAEEAYKHNHQAKQEFNQIAKS